MSTRSLTGLVALVACLAVATAARAEAPDLLATDAHEAHEAHCAPLASGETLVAADALVQVSRVWGRLGDGWAEHREPYLLYWRGLIAQCLGQFDSARRDLRTFVRAEGRRAVLADQVDDARRRLRVMSTRAEVETRPTRGWMHFGTAFLLFQRVERADAEPTPWVGQLFDVGFFAHRSVSIDLSIQTNGTQIPVSAGASLHLRLAGAQPFVGARFVVLFDLQEVGGAGLVSYGPALLAGFDFVPADRVGLFLQASVALIRLPGSVTAFEPDPTLLSISPIAGGLLLRF